MFPAITAKQLRCCFVLNMTLSSARMLPFKNNPFSSKTKQQAHTHEKHAHAKEVDIYTYQLKPFGKLQLIFISEHFKKV